VSANSWGHAYGGGVHMGGAPAWRPALAVPWACNDGRMRSISVLVPLFLLASVLGGCGDSADPDSGPDSGTPSSTAPAEPTVVGVWSATAAGGRRTGPAVDVSTGKGREALLGGLRGPLVTDVSAAIDAAAVSDGQRLVGGIVSIGCGTLTGATVVQRNGGVAFEPVFAVKPPPECFAAVTGVALALVPADWPLGSAGEQVS